jgi:endonuclease YncB( thermonuclease family)
VEVFPLEKNGVMYGAIHTGIHNFYAVEDNKSEYLTSIAKFTHVWMLENGDFKLTRVLDGDTVGFEAKFLPDPLKKELLIRVYGVDTPEKGHRAQCPQENTKGLAATEFTKTTIANGKKIQVAIATWDKFGGRVLGDVLIDGKSLRVALIKNGYAREYYGLAKESWCN